MPAFVEDLRRRAEEAARTEAEYRSEARDRLAALEQARILAYRRVEMIDALARTVAAGEDRVTATDAGVSTLSDMTGWSSADAAYDEVRQQLSAVADQAWLAEHPAEADGKPVDVVQAFVRFEAWYAERFKAAFTSLIARDAPSLTPLVDF
jgi:hypothetical protein